MALGKKVTQANVYTKVSNLNNPFWGLTKNQLDELRRDPRDYYVRFEYPAGSIVLTSSEVQSLIANKSVAQDGDYKITLADFR